MATLIKSATLNDAAKAIVKGQVRNTLLAGPPGVGKTTFAFDIAEFIKRPAWKVQFHAESTPSEVVGMFVPDSGTFKWESGPLDMAYTQGGVLILDEIVEASGPCKTFLYGALDDGKGGTISYVGRTFTPHPEYRVIATMNGWPTDGGLPEALLDRFDAVFIITTPAKKQLALLEPDLRELCEDSYATAPDPMLGPDITFRMYRAYQKLRNVLTMDQAALSACRGNEKLTGTFLEVLALADPAPTAKATVFVPSELPTPALHSRVLPPRPSEPGSVSSMPTEPPALREALKTVSTPPDHSRPISTEELARRKLEMAREQSAKRRAARDKQKAQRAGITTPASEASDDWD